jgi:hypothetical protein
LSRKAAPHLAHHVHVIEFDPAVLGERRFRERNPNNLDGSFSCEGLVMLRRAGVGAVSTMKSSGAGLHRWQSPDEGAKMVTRSTTKKTRTGAKPFAVRGSGKLKGARGLKRAQAVDLHHMSAAQVGARLDEVENRALRAARRVARVGRNSMQEVVVAAKAVRLSFKEAVVAVRRAMRNIAKQVTAASQSVWPTA